MEAEENVHFDEQADQEPDEFGASEHDAAVDAQHEGAAEEAGDAPDESAPAEESHPLYDDSNPE